MRRKLCHTLILFSLAAPAGLLAQPVAHDSVRVSLKAAGIDALARVLEKQTGLHFFYDSLQLASFKITLEAGPLPLNALLGLCFQKTPYHYAVDPRGFVLLTRSREIDTGVPPASGNTADSSARSFFREEATKTDERGLPAPEFRQPEKVLVVGDSLEHSKSPTATIAGYVRDHSTGEPLAGASVWADQSVAAVVTDESGYYSLRIPRGSHTLHFRTLGMTAVQKKIRLIGDGRVDIELQKEVQILKNVVVAAQRNSLVNSSSMGVQKIDLQTLKQLPVLFGEADVLKAVLTLPGVKTAGEASTGLNVRGGSADQNLILFNGSTIYNPSHFFGLFSAFNPELIQDVELYKSSMPARLGGRLSSVLDITSKEGNRKKVSGQAGIGLLTSRLVLEGPLKKDHSAFILGIRSTYANWLLGLLPVQYRNSQAYFGDLSFEATQSLGSKSELQLSLYASADRFNLNSDTLYGYGNRNAALRWKHRFSNKWLMQNALGFDRYQYKINSDRVASTAYDLSFDINQAWWRNDFTFYASSRHKLESGFSTLLYKIHPGNYRPMGNESLVKPVNMETEQALESAVYLGDQVSVSHALSIDAGIRFSLFQYLGPHEVNLYAPDLPVTSANKTGSRSYGAGQVLQTYGGPEYRFSLRFAISDSFSLKAGINTQRQYIHSLSNSTAMAPTDIWKLSDPHIRPQEGVQYSLGAYRNLRSNQYEVSLEVYYKTIRNYLDYRSGAQLVLNEAIETAVLSTRGRAYGLEFMLKKKAGKLNGWISYTYSRILLRMNDSSAGEIINHGEEYPASYDKPHEATLVSNYRFNHRFSISFNLNYSTGRPITVPAGRYFFGGSYRTLYSDRNSYRIPDYFRADLSLQLEGNHRIRQKTHNSWTLGVYNLTGRKNAYSVYYVAENGVINGYKLSIFGSAIPYVNFNIRF